MRALPILKLKDLGSFPSILGRSCPRLLQSLLLPHLLFAALELSIVDVGQGRSMLPQRGLIDKGRSLGEPLRLCGVGQKARMQGLRTNAPFELVILQLAPTGFPSQLPWVVTPWSYAAIYCRKLLRPPL